MPHDWEIETDLTPLARALSSRASARCGEAWRRVLTKIARRARSRPKPPSGSRAMRSARASADRAAHAARRAACSVARSSQRRSRRLQAGWTRSSRAFSLYLTASRLDAHTARGDRLARPVDRPPLVRPGPALVAGRDRPRAAPRRGRAPARSPAPRARPRRTASATRAGCCWPKAIIAAGPLGVRTLGRNVRSRLTEPADEERSCAFGSPMRAPRIDSRTSPGRGIAWRSCWHGRGSPNARHEPPASRTALAGRPHCRSRASSVLRTLVDAGLGRPIDGLSTAARPFPSELFAPNLIARLRLR